MAKITTLSPTSEQHTYEDPTPLSVLTLVAFAAWLKTDVGRAFGKVADAKGIALLPVFEAGWNAARAEARSDASQATGGRLYADKNEDGSPIMVGDRQKYHEREDR